MSDLLSDKEQALISQEYPGYWTIEYPRAVAKAQDAKTKKGLMDFIGWLDNGTRSSASWRSEMRKFGQAIQKEVEDG